MLKAHDSRDAAAKIYLDGSLYAVQTVLLVSLDYELILLISFFASFIKIFMPWLYGCARSVGNV